LIEDIIDREISKEALSSLTMLFESLVFPDGCYRVCCGSNLKMW
jgi:hypothetical protein